MCLIALAWKTRSRWPLVLLGNRDEHYDRPTAALHRWEDSPILAGRDLQAGGTWMGISPNGRTAVVTNVRDGVPQPFPGPSRGALPQAFLTSQTSAIAHAEALAKDAHLYAPFNLIVADNETCAYVGNHPASGAHAIAPGVHGLSNGDFDEDWPKTRMLRDALQQWVDAGSEDLTSLWAALANRDPAPDEALPNTGIERELERRLSSAFVREKGYGTRASTIILVDHTGCGIIIERSFNAQGDLSQEVTLTTDA